MVRVAGVSHGTFYLYFANKEELVRALAERCADEADALAAALPPISPDAEGRDGAARPGWPTTSRSTGGTAW